MAAEGQGRHPPPTSDGMVVTARKWPNTVAPATMSMIMQEIRAVSCSDRNNFRHVIFFPTAAMRIVPREPMPAASVGVKMPTNSPPITMTNRANVSIIPAREAIISRNGARAPFWQRSGRRAVQITTARTKKSESRIPGTTPAMKSFPIDCSVMIP